MVHTDTTADDITDIFLSVVSEVAFQHDCKILGCGFDGEEWWVELDGLPKNQDKVLSAIGKLFARWDRDRVWTIPIKTVPIYDLDRR